MNQLDDQSVTTVRPGEVFDHYRIESVVAHGRGATTFRAIDLQTNQPVALETPHQKIENDPVLSQHFQREEEIDKSLVHPGLIKLIEKRGRRQGHGRSYMVREWFEGVSMRELLSKGKPPTEQAIRITVSICAVMEYIHNHGIVLRDIEPDPVLVGENDEVKLIHVGMTSKLGARRLTFTKLSQVVGTSQYISPEELKGQRSDARSDIYSIGVMLYEMLTGRLPFQGERVEDRLLNYPVPPREIDPSISPQLQEVIYRALEREPRNRYANAHDFARDLEHLNEVGVADRAELRDWTKGRSSQPRRVVLYVVMALIPIVIFALLFYFANR